MPSVVTMLERITALRTEVTFDVDAVMFLDFGAQLMRNEMKRLFVHGAVFNRIDCATRGFGPSLEAALQHIDDGGFAAADGTHQKQNAFAYLETLGRGFEVLDELRDGFFDAK